MFLTGHDIIMDTIVTIGTDDLVWLCNITIILMMVICIGFKAVD